MIISNAIYMSYVYTVYIYIYIIYTPKLSEKIPITISISRGALL